MTARLANRTLPTLPKSIGIPRYDRAAVSPGIVHLGVGAFHRAHQAVYVEQCLSSGQTNWGIVGASLQSAATQDALRPQDGLYTLVERGGGGERLRVVGSIGELLTAARDPHALLSAMTHPRIRLITLTITEKAYMRNASGDLDDAHPGIQDDLAHPHAPRTALGLLVEALARRREAATPPFSVLSCDNLPANGATLHRLLIQFAARRDASLARHLEDVSCPSCMVDRIVPATTAGDRAHVMEALGVEDAWPVMTEAFTQWVVEDDFPGGRPDWEPFGVQMVRDVRPFEDMKLRLLNGAHSAIAYLGLLSGHETVASAFAAPEIRRFVRQLWDEAATTLPRGAGLDPETYVAALTERFDNRALAHRTAQIANDGSQKMPQRIVGSALDRLEAGATAGHLMLVVAAWIRACELRGSDAGIAAFTDPLDGRLAALASERLPATETVAAVFELTGIALGSQHRAHLEVLAATHLDILRKRGVGAALAQICTGESV